MGKAMRKDAVVKTLTAMKEVMKNDDVEVLEAEDVGNASELAVSTANSVAVPESFQLPSGYKVKRVVTVPSLVMKHVGAVWFIRIDSELRTSKVEGKLKKDGTREDPATVAEVTLVDTGEKRILLAPAVLIKHLNDDYPDASYVGKFFSIQNLGKLKPEQRHTDFNIVEISQDE